MYRFLSLALVILVLVFVFNFSVHISVPSPADFIPTPTAAPRILIPVSSGVSAPAVSAKHVFIMDRGSKTVLFSKSADTQLYPASTTKMMTALVARSVFSPSQEITVTTGYPEGTKIGLKPGEKVSADNLFYALLVESANDAAEVLAENFPGGRTAFVSAMNTQAATLRLSETHFLNPTGLDQSGHFSSASDLTRLADYLLDDDYLRRIVSVENAVITSSDQSRVYPLANVNQLLGKVPGVLGIKTGFTDLAGQSLITLVSRDGHEVILSVMAGTGRFTDSEKLIDWVYSNFAWK